jgi:hypothetical protein
MRTSALTTPSFAVLRKMRREELTKYIRALSAGSKYSAVGALRLPTRGCVAYGRGAIGYGGKGSRRRHGDDQSPHVLRSSRSCLRDQRTGSGLLSAVLLPAELVAVTLHWALWPRSLPATARMRPLAPGFVRPPTRHR